MVKTVPAKSRYIDKLIYQYEDSSAKSFAYVINYYIQAPRYMALCHDPYRKKIYRMARHAQPLINANKLANKVEDANLSILVFDEDFNFEGEVMIGSGYSERFLGCLPEGIALVKMRDEKNRSALEIKELKIE